MMNLTEYLLVSFQEDLAETSKAVSKCLKYGVNNGHPEAFTTNEQDLKLKMNHLVAMMGLLVADGLDVGVETDESIAEAKVEKIKNNLLLSQELGIIP